MKALLHVVSCICVLVVRLSKEGGWKLPRAWQTAADGRILEEYPVP